MSFSFNPNFIGTQTTSIKPQIVEWTGFTGTALSALTTAPVSPSQSAATEGQWAWAAFKFVNPTGGAIQQLMDSALLNLNLTGASADDYVNGGQLFAYALDQNGAVVNTASISQPVGTTPKTSNSIYFPDSTLDPVGGGTGVYGLLMAVKVKADTVIETSDRALFQVTNNDHTKFTNSAYVEKYVDIVDQFTASTRPMIVVSGEYTVPGITTTASSNRVITNHVKAQLIDGAVTTSSSIYEGTTFAGAAPILTAFPGTDTVDAVKEGQWAIGKFSFVSTNTTTNHSGADSLPLDYATQVKVGYTGASAADYSAGSFKVYATNGFGLVWNSGTSAFVSAGGGTALTVNSAGIATVPAGATDVILTVRTAQDTLVESGEEVIFQVGKVDVNSFAGSDYVEKKVAIQDSFNTFNVTNPAPGTSLVYNLNSGEVDEVTIGTAASPGGFPGSYVSNGTGLPGAGNMYVTLSGFGAGDYLKIDMQQISGVFPYIATVPTYTDVTSPSLSLVNFGVLNLAEPDLIVGLRQLDGVGCNVGGVYVMGDKNNNTYIVVDSNSDGLLTMNAGANGDVFVKLTGIAPSSIESTDFMLV
jgi:hypothetical protein